MLYNSTPSRTFFYFRILRFPLTNGPCLIASGKQRAKQSRHKCTPEQGSFRGALASGTRLCNSWWVRAGSRESRHDPTSSTAWHPVKTSLGTPAVCPKARLPWLQGPMRRIFADSLDERKWDVWSSWHMVGSHIWAITRFRVLSCRDTRQNLWPLTPSSPLRFFNLSSILLISAWDCSTWLPPYSHCWVFRPGSHRAKSLHRL